MSHASLWLITDKGNSDEVLNAKITELMQPFNENMKVEPYLEYEYSKRLEYYKSELKETGDRLLKSDICNIDYAKKRIEKLKAITPEEYYDDMISGYNYDDNKNVFSTYNPNSKWDWYEVGGRWDRSLILKNGDIRNIAKIFDIDFDKTEFPFAILLDGEWIENGELGLFGLVVGEIIPDAVYRKHQRSIIDNLPNDKVIIVIDYHV